MELLSYCYDTLHLNTECPVPSRPNHDHEIAKNSALIFREPGLQNIWPVRYTAFAAK